MQRWREGNGRYGLTAEFHWRRAASGDDSRRGLQMAHQIRAPLRKSAHLGVNTGSMRENACTGLAEPRHCGMTAPDTSVAPLSPGTIRRLRELNDRFTDVGAAERANYQIYLMKLCEAIGVEEPRPAASTGGRVAENTAYQFEFSVQTTTRDGVVSTNYIDLYKSGCFALEAKHSAEGTSATTLLTKAFGQVSNYARDLSDRPPYIMVLDVGKTLIIWDRWQGTYGGYHLGHRIDLRTLADRPEDVALLRDIWNDPARRDPRRHAQQITVEIAGLLAELSSTLELRGHDPERSPAS